VLCPVVLWLLCYVLLCCGCTTLLCCIATGFSNIISALLLFVWGMHHACSSSSS